MKNALMNKKLAILVITVVLFAASQNAITGAASASGQDAADSSATATAQKKPPRVLLYFGLYTQWYRIKESLEPIPGHTLRISNARTDGADFIANEKELSAFDVVVMSDVNYDSIKESGLAAIESFVKKGGGLVVLGGPFTYGAGKYDGTVFADILPVETTGPFDIKWKKKGKPFSVAKEHAIIKDLDLRDSPHVYWIHDTRPKPGSTQVLKAGKRPLLVLGKYGKGRVAVFLGTPMGEASKDQIPFWKWKEWDKLVRNTFAWLTPIH